MNPKPYLDEDDDFCIELSDRNSFFVTNKHANLEGALRPIAGIVDSDNTRVVVELDLTLDELITRLEALRTELPALSAKYRMMKS